jgi:hypothetical protein
VEKAGHGGIAAVADSPEGPVYGRSMVVADRLADGRLVLAKWVRRLVAWHGREIPAGAFEQNVRATLEARLRSQDLDVVRFVEHPQTLSVLVDVGRQTVKAPVDRLGVPLWKPREREVMQPECAGCGQVATCRRLSAAPGTASTWRRLGLVDARGVPTRRGRIVSFFSGGDGLAVAAALEDEAYGLEELSYDLANLDAGFRFCGEQDRWGGRLAYACRRAYGPFNAEGYLDNGVPPKYGSGAETVVRAVHREPQAKARFVNRFLGDGDIDRVIIEWRSLLRQVAHAPRLDWARWTSLQGIARSLMHEVGSPTDTGLPPLEHHQTRRVDHRLVLRRH